MNQDMNNLNDIISNLTPDDIDMLKGVASSILAGQGDARGKDVSDGVNGDGAQNMPKETQSSRVGQNALKNTQNVNMQNGQVSPAQLLQGFENIDFNMLMKAKMIFDKMNNTPNKNADLITALRPHLRPETQNKADQAIKILKLFEILPLLRELF